MSLDPAAAGHVEADRTLQVSVHQMSTLSMTCWSSNEQSKEIENY